MNLKIKTLLREPIYILLMVLVLIFFPCLFAGKTLFYRDLSLQDYPLIKYSVDLIWKGEIPLWNDRVLSGFSQLASIQPPIFYPGFILYIIFPFHIALSLLLIIHYFLAGLGIYLIGKYFNFSKESSLLGAIVYSLNGYMFEMTNLQYLVYASTWIPYCFLFFTSLIEKKDRNSLIYLVISFSLLILTGRLDYFYFTSIFLFIWFLGFFIIKKEINQIPINQNTIILILLSFLFPILISSTQIIPSLDYVKNSFRGQSLTFNGATMWSMSSIQLVHLIFNNFFGNIFSYNGIFHYIDSTFLVYNLYIGFNVFFLILIGIDLKDRKNIVLFILFIIFTILSFGKHTPVYEFFFNYIPGFSFLRYPIKLFIFSLFSLSIISMIGLENLISNEKKLRYIYLSFFFLCLFLIFYIKNYETSLVKYFNEVISSNGIKIENLDFIISSISFSLISSVLFLVVFYYLYIKKVNQNIIKYSVIILILYELVNYNLSNLWVIDKNKLYEKSTIAYELENLLKNDIEKYYFITDTERKVNYNTETLVKIVNDFSVESTNLSANFSINSKLLNAFGYSPSPPLNIFKLITWINDEIPSVVISSDQKAKIMKLMGVKYYIWYTSNVYTRKPDSKYMNLVKKFPEQQIEIWELKKTEPIISSKNKIVYFNDQDEIAKTLVGFKNKNINLDDTILVFDPEKKNNLRENISDMFQDVRIKVINRKNNYLSLKVYSKSKHIVKISQNYSRNWKLFINDKEAKLLEANFYQMAFEVPSGTNNVILKYQEPKLFYSLIITLVATFVSTLFFFKKNLKIYV